MKWLSVLMLLAAAATVQAETVRWTLNNPAGAYSEEMLRLPIKLQAPYAAQKLVVKEDGKEVPYQVEVHEGTADRVLRGDIWVCTSVPAKGTRQFEVTTDGTPTAFKPKVTVTPVGDDVEISNGLIRLRAPGKDAASARGPILGVASGDGKFVGESRWTLAQLLSDKPTMKAAVSQGPLFGQVALQYRFTGAGRDSAFGEAMVTLRVVPGRPVVFVRESHRMIDGDSWTFEISKGWAPRNCMVRINNDGGGAGAGSGFPRHKWPTTLQAGQTRMGDTHVQLLPRWSQSFDDGWFFAAHDGARLIGAIPAHAGQWFWPHENKIAAKVKDSGDYAALQLPTHRGARTWLLVAGPLALAESPGRKDPIADLVAQTTMHNLNKIVHDYIYEWPGKPGGFQGAFFFGSGTNPTGGRRGMGRQAVASAGKQGDLSTLLWTQVNMDPDWYGTYYNYWSPENPNFFTDFIKAPIALTAQLREHPRFPELRARAEALLREDMDHSITLPGGAGQECPGYLNHGLAGWAQLAPVCKEYLGFDPTTWPRYKAAQEFQKHASFPDGTIRRMNPAGDTHPGPDGPRPVEVAPDEVKAYTTEELPGFGVVFRNRAGTDQETFMSFKSGPNRGHYHGDQLAFHLCLGAKPVAVDHHCSYMPRAGQEHMHNRVAFSLPGKPGFEYANMDGYERVIAFKPGEGADVAVAQVESPRLRAMRKLPPEEWDNQWKNHPLKAPLVYRRTVVLVKGQRDCFVLRDQYWSEEKDLAAHWHLHALGEKAEQKGATIECGGVNTFVAKPAEFKSEKFEWEHSNGGLEKTAGPRLTVAGAEGEFITVIYPPGMTAKIEAIKGGVKIGDCEVLFANYLGNRTSNGQIGQSAKEVTITRGGREVAALLTSDIDFERSQGDISLFVPDAGYPFGPIPDWLIKQRARTRPELVVKEGVRK